MEDLRLMNYLHLATLTPTTLGTIRQQHPQMWYPIDGYELRAPVTWSVMPGR